MPDMLVKLYDFEKDSALLEGLRSQGIVVKRAMTPEMGKVLDFIRANFGEGWASEAAASFARIPVSCFVAADLSAPKGQQVVGFGCYEATAPDFFGPTGVHPAYRGRGIGLALLHCCLDGLKSLGYGYAIIGGAGPVDFYKKACGAVPIEGSAPGIYRDML